jgi:hypothetical protein
MTSTIYNVDREVEHVTSWAHFRVFHARSVSLHNLSLALGFIARLRIADPCVSRKPFMRRVAVWTVGLPEKDRARAENRGLPKNATRWPPIDRWPLWHIARLLSDTRQSSMLSSWNGTAAPRIRKNLWL